MRQWSLDQVDLENLLLDRIADAQTRMRNRERDKNPSFGGQEF